MYIYLNGQVVVAEKARISPLDHGFLYGAGLFETMRTVQGRPMFFAAHMARLRDSADALGFAVPWTDEELEQGILDTMAANRLPDAYVRLTVTRGEGALGPSGKSCGQPTLVIYVKELQLPPASVYEKGRNLHVLDTIRSTSETSVRTKSLNYLNSLLAYRELELRGGGEGIQLTREGFVAEGAVSNLFFVVNGELWTPSLETGILPGVTREWVLREAEKTGVAVREACFTLADIANASEAFTTSSVVGLIPAVSINAAAVGSGAAGPVTTALMARWADLTGAC